MDNLNTSKYKILYIRLFIPGPESIKRREENMAVSLTADFLPAPGRPIKITPRRFVPKAQLKPTENMKDILLLHFQMI